MTATARHLTIAAVKTIGLFFVVNAARLLISSLFMGAPWLSRFLLPSTVGGVVWMTAEASVGLVLILRTRWVVDLLFRESGAEPDDAIAAGTAHELVAIMMVVAGAVLALFALPPLLADLVRLVFMLGWDDLAERNVRGSIFWSVTIRHAMAVLVGLWFVRNWAGVLRRLTGSSDFDPPQRLEDAN